MALGLQGPVRRIHFAPPAAEDLVRGSGNPSSSGNARVSVLFASGTFGIWELDSRNELQQVFSFDACAAHQAVMSPSLLAGFLLLLLTSRILEYGITSSPRLRGNEVMS